jgi:hypothetical protein
MRCCCFATSSRSNEVLFVAQTNNKFLVQCSFRKVERSEKLKSPEIDRRSGVSCSEQEERIGCVWMFGCLFIAPSQVQLSQL